MHRGRGAEKRRRGLSFTDNGKEAVKKFFYAGLLLWIPLAVTLWVLESIIRWSDSLIALLPVHLNPDGILGFHVPGIGLVLAAIVILATGILVANVIGQWFVKLWESLLDRIPFVRPIYSGVKQILQTVLSDQTQSFKEVVLVEYPRKGCWTYGFVVAEPSESTDREAGAQELVTLFVPTAPNPTSGYVVLVERSQLRKTSVTIDQAFKFHISMGVMTPEAVKTAQNEAEKSAKTVSSAPTQAQRSGQKR